MKNTLKRNSRKIALCSMINEPAYPFHPSDRGDYYNFTSHGKNGSIDKIARFDRLGSNVYNIAFGDWNGNAMHDRTVSNNGDKDKILITVGRIISHFTEASPEALVFARGVDQRRTRLYQQGINKHWHHIGPFFAIWGFLDGQWSPFRKGINYQAFLGCRHPLFPGRLITPDNVNY